MPLGGKTAVARQRGGRPPQILAARGSPSRWRGRPRVGSRIAREPFARQTPNPAMLQGRRIAGLINRTRRMEGRTVYVAPGCFAHPKCQAFWLGGESGGRPLPPARRVPRAARPLALRGASPLRRGTEAPVPRRSGVGQTSKRVCGEGQASTRAARRLTHVCRGWPGATMRCACCEALCKPWRPGPCGRRLRRRHVARGGRTRGGRAAASGRLMRVRRANSWQCSLSLSLPPPVPLPLLPPLAPAPSPFPPL